MSFRMRKSDGSSFYPRQIDVKAALLRLDEYELHLLGVRELRAILEVKHSTLCMRVKNSSNLPPYTKLACGPVWKKMAVRVWLNGLKR